MRCFFGALNKELKKVDLNCLGYQHFVGFEKPRYKQSRKNQSSVSFFSAKNNKHGSGKSLSSVIGLAPCFFYNEIKVKLQSSCFDEFVFDDEEKLKFNFIMIETEKNAIINSSLSKFKQRIEMSAYALRTDRNHSAIKIRLNYKNERCQKDPWSVLTEAFAKANQDLTSACRYLDLSACQIGDNLIVEHLEEIKIQGVSILETAQVLILSDNKISDSGYDNITEYLITQKNSLRYLLLDGNYIHLPNLEKETQALKDKCPHLVHIDLSGNSLIKPLENRYITEDDLPEMQNNEETHVNHLFLKHSLRFHSELSEKRKVKTVIQSDKEKSVLDSSKELTHTNGLVCLLDAKEGLHSWLAIEYLCESGQRRLLVTDLVVDMESGQIQFRLFQNTPSEFLVKYGNSTFKTTAIVDRKKIFTALLPEIFESQGIKEFYNYAMLPSINKATQLNCRKWVVDKLLPKVGIPKSDEWQEYIPVNGFCSMF